MKIAYFINEYPKVSHSFIRREILALERQGFEVQRIALRGWSGPLPDAEDQDERVRTRYVLAGGAWRLLGPLLGRLLRDPVRLFKAVALAIHAARSSDRSLLHHLAYVAEACRICPWMTSFGAQHVHAHFGTNSTTVVMLARELGGPPYSFTAHGPEEFYRPMGLTEKIGRSSFVVAISSFGRSQLYLWAAYRDWPKVKVVHCGLDRGFYVNAVPTVPAVPRLVCVGRLTEAKGQPLLIEAAARLEARGIPFELVLAGDGPLRAALETQIDRLHLAQRIRITGWISSEQVRAEILAARALVLPSFAEGLPVVIMEAMALRRPVITTYVAGIPELVRHGDTGWLLPAGCIDSLTEAMQQCLQLPSSALQAMGNAGYERVIVAHSVDVEAGKLAALFRSSGGG